MLIGVKDGKAVAVRGNPDSPCQPRQALPQGPERTSHYRAPGRATQPLLRKHGKLVPVTGTKRSTPWSSAFGIDPGQARQASRLVLSALANSLTEEFYTLGKLVQLGFGTPNYDGNTTLCMASAVSGYKLRLAAMDLPAPTPTWRPPT